MGGPSQEPNFDPREMAYSANMPIPSYKNQNTPSHFHSSTPADDDANRPSTSPNVPFSANNRREKPGRGAGRPFVKPSGMNDPYGIDIALLNMFENQVIPVGVHNLSKTLRPNMATIRVLSLGTKFIPKWRDANLKQTFRKFGDFKRRLQNSMFFVETTPGTFGRNKQFHLKNYFVAKDTFNEVDEFCWQLRDGINEMVENHVKKDVISNLSFKEKKALRKLITEKNKIHVNNDMDKSRASKRGQMRCNHGI